MGRGRIEPLKRPKVVDRSGREWLGQHGPLTPATRRPRSGLRVAVVGCGYWGSKHVRVLSSFGDVCRVALVEPNPGIVRAMLAGFPAAQAFPNLEAALPHIDAAIIATPPRIHSDLALTVLRHGKHVLVEKPLATSVAAAQLLVNEARRAGTILMAGHTFQFNPAVRELRRRLQQGDFGKIYYIHSARLNLGLYRSDVNVVWDLAPHDLCILNYLLHSDPTTVTAWGASLACPNVEDLAYIRLEYRDPAVVGYIHLSWLDPRKTRTVTVVGSKRMAVYDDLAEERLRIYDRGVQGLDGGSAPFERPISYRNGNIVSPYIRADEPLALQDKHFVDCILNDRRPETAGENALAVIAALEAVDKSLRTRSAVEVSPPPDLTAVEISARSVRVGGVC